MAGYKYGNRLVKKTCADARGRMPLRDTRTEAYCVPCLADGEACCLASHYAIASCLDKNYLKGVNSMKDFQQEIQDLKLDEFSAIDISPSEKETSADAVLVLCGCGCGCGRPPRCGCGCPPRCGCGCPPRCGCGCAPRCGCPR